MRSESFIRLAWHELRMHQVQKARADLAQRPFTGVTQRTRDQPATPE